MAEVTNNAELCFLLSAKRRTAKKARDEEYAKDIPAPAAATPDPVPEQSKSAKRRAAKKARDKQYAQDIPAPAAATPDPVPEQSKSAKRRAAKKARDKQYAQDILAPAAATPDRVPEQSKSAKRRAAKKARDKKYAQDMSAPAPAPEPVAEHKMEAAKVGLDPLQPAGEPSFKMSPNQALEETAAVQDVNGSCQSTHYGVCDVDAPCEAEEIGHAVGLREPERIGHHAELHLAGRHLLEGAPLACGVLEGLPCFGYWGVD